MSKIRILAAVIEELPNHEKVRCIYLARGDKVYCQMIALDSDKEETLDEEG